MPTGYTNEVADGKITKFSDFAKVCARAFGAYVSLRDSPSGIELPKEIQVDDHYIKSVEDAIKSGEDWNNLSMDDKRILHKNEYDEKINYNMNRVAEIKQTLERYRSMKEKVIIWNPPNEIQKLKEFMLSQLDDSLKFDDTLSYYDITAEEQKVEFNQWLKNKQTDIEKNIEFYKKSLSEEIERKRISNQWISEFFKSLPKD